MVEAVMFWNEPNNKSHWAFEIDPEWQAFAEMVNRASRAVAAENPRMLRVLGGLSPIDANFVLNMARQGVLDEVDVVAVSGELDFDLAWKSPVMDMDVACVEHGADFPDTAAYAPSGAYWDAETDVLVPGIARQYYTPPMGTCLPLAL